MCINHSLYLHWVSLEYFCSICASSCAAKDIFYTKINSVALTWGTWIKDPRPLCALPLCYSGYPNFVKTLIFNPGSKKSCDHCKDEDSVCSVEGCIKFNPFYVREIREKSGNYRMSGEKSTVLRFESAPDNSKTMSGNPERSSNQPGQALCEVVLDAVWHAQQVKTLSSIKAGQQHCC